MSKFIGHFWRNVLLYIELLVDIFSFNILNMQSRSLWPTGFVLRTLTTLVKIPCMWWVTLLLFNHLSLCAQSLWIYFTWSLLKSLYLYIRTFCQIWESGVISLNQLAVCFPLYSPSAVTAAAKYFANKGPSSQGYGLPSGHVWMWALDCEESWVDPVEKVL